MLMNKCVLYNKKMLLEEQMHVSSQWTGTIYMYMYYAQVMEQVLLWTMTDVGLPGLETEKLTDDYRGS